MPELARPSLDKREKDAGQYGPGVGLTYVRVA